MKQEVGGEIGANKVSAPIAEISRAKVPIAEISRAKVPIAEANLKLRETFHV